MEEISEKKEITKEYLMSLRSKLKNELDEAFQSFQRDLKAEDIRELNTKVADIQSRTRLLIMFIISSCELDNLSNTIDNVKKWQEEITCEQLFSQN